MQQILFDKKKGGGNARYKMSDIMFYTYTRTDRLQKNHLLVFQSKASFIDVKSN